jgi:predicted negative regulator of RcsB-dependent stress response
MGRFREGAAQFARALAAKPLPEFYLARARALAKADSKNLRDVVHGLDEGLAGLGPVVTLQLLALDLELQIPDYPAALSRLDAITLQATRKEVWLARRGDVLQQAGREAEAKAAWEAALAALAQLPIERRDTRAMKTLESRVRESLQAAR